MTPPSSHPRDERGFSLVELLIVVGIIALLAAVSIPQIGSYIRNYKLRGAQQQVADQLQTARSKAVMKNVQLGAIWLQTTGAIGGSSGWAVEDDLQPTVGPPWTSYGTENLTTLLADRAQSPGLTKMPNPIDFDDPSRCPGGGPAANAWGIRFNNLGAICQVGTANCPAPIGVPAVVNRVAFCPAGQPGCSAGDASVCVWDRSNNLRRRVTVTVGGRVLIQ